MNDARAAPSAAPEPIIRVENLVKRYRQASANAVDGVSFDVARGEFFALLGPNGAGKTTTVSVLTTILLPTSGRALVAGHDVATEPAAVRRRSGIIFQNPSIDQHLTAEENVRLHAVLYGLYPLRPTFGTMPTEYRQRIGELSEVLGIRDAMFEPIRTFSGGMKRKLEILRSLIHRPEVLFLDEPTTGLDPSSRRNLWSYLEGVRAKLGTTLLLTTHYLEEAEKADRICIMGRGRVVSYGSPAQVKADLVHDYVLVDADDRIALRRELDERGILHVGDGPVRIDVPPHDVHQVLRSIQTPLTLVRTHTPSLEDAYLEIIERPAALVSDESAHVDVVEGPVEGRPDVDAPEPPAAEGAVRR